MPRWTAQQLKDHQSGKKTGSRDANALTDAGLILLRASGFQAWRQNNLAAYDPKLQAFRKFNGRHGVSDIIGFHESTGLFCAVEVKTENDRLSDAQRDFLNQVEKAGGFAHELRDLQTMQEKITDWLKKTRR